MSKIAADPPSPAERGGGLLGWLVCDPEVQRGFKYGQGVLQNVRRWFTVAIVVLLVVIVLQLTITSALLFYVRKTTLNIVRLQRRSLMDIVSSLSMTGVVR